MPAQLYRRWWRCSRKSERTGAKGIKSCMCQRMRHSHAQAHLTRSHPEEFARGSRKSTLCSLTLSAFRSLHLCASGATGQTGVTGRRSVEWQHCMRNANWSLASKRVAGVLHGMAHPMATVCTTAWLQWHLFRNPCPNGLATNASASAMLL